jgi:hypothetical protein
LFCDFFCGPAGETFADFARFFEGVGEKAVFLDGEIVVSWWWIDGGLW